MSFLDGFRTKIAGVAGMLGSLAALLKDLSGPFSIGAVEKDAAAFLASLAIFGLAGKLQKLIDLLKK